MCCGLCMFIHSVGAQRQLLHACQQSFLFGMHQLLPLEAAPFNPDTKISLKWNKNIYCMNLWKWCKINIIQRAKEKTNLQVWTIGHFDRCHIRRKLLMEFFIGSSYYNNSVSISHWIEIHIGQILLTICVRNLLWDDLY